MASLGHNELLIQCQCKSWLQTGDVTDHAVYICHIVHTVPKQIKYMWLVDMIYYSSSSVHQNEDVPMMQSALKYTLS